MSDPLLITDYRLVDAADVIVTFSRAVHPQTATVPANYVFSPALVVEVVERISDTQYLLRTERQRPSTIYTVTVSNVQALDGQFI